MFSSLIGDGKAGGAAPKRMLFRPAVVVLVSGTRTQPVQLEVFSSELVLFLSAVRVGVLILFNSLTTQTKSLELLALQPSRRVRFEREWFRHPHPGRAQVSHS